jgi:chorismate synthase
LSGAIKYNHKDLQNVLERASARETAIRTAIGAVCKQILEQVDIKVTSDIIQVGNVTNKEDFNQAIDEAKASGDSLGGKVKVTATGMAVGIGSYVHYDRKIDAKLAHDVMSVQLVKGIQIGEDQTFVGSTTHDQITYSEDKGFHRLTNHSGGIEGGMTTGMSVVIQADIKPIPTLYTPLDSVDMLTKNPSPSMVERSDTCGVPAVAVVLEAVVATTLTQEILKQFTSDTMKQLIDQVNQYREYTRTF